MFVARSVMDVLGCATEKDRKGLADLQLQAQQAPARPLTAEEIDSLVHADLRGPLHQLLIAAEPVLRKVLPAPEPLRAEKVTARGSPRLAALLARLARVYGAPAVAACQVEGGVGELAVADSGTPLLVVGRAALDELEDPQVLFAVSRLVARIRLRFPLYLGLEPTELGRVISALLAATCRTFVPPCPPQELRDLGERIEKAMGKRVRRQIESLSLDVSDRAIDPLRWRLAMEQTEDRMALAACGDVQAALRHLLRAESSRETQGLETPVVLAAVAGPRFKALLTFVLGEEYLTLRERLGVALRD